MTTTASFLRQLDDIIKNNSMLRHPFYQTWTEGKLSRYALREYAKQYYRFVEIFPTLVSATHANTPQLSVRQELLENLIEEERGDGNHPGLWLKFAASLGVTAEEAASTPMLPETRNAIDVLKGITHNGSYLEGISALYAYESQIPEVASVKIDGLKKFYSINDTTSLSYFIVHHEADVHHSGSEQKILAQYAITADDWREVIAAAERSCKAVLQLLDGVYREYVQSS
jgi:pyrroloquinoline-quinone synthase